MNVIMTKMMFTVVVRREITLIEMLTIITMMPTVTVMTPTSILTFASSSARWKIKCCQAQNFGSSESGNLILRRSW